jgi:myo-inositol-1(or 4)-monophosphatase
VIVREAGGVVTDWDGDDQAWLRSGNILAASPAVHAALREIASSTR